MNRHAVIISGGTVEDGFVLKQLEQIEDSYIIGVDKGAEFLYRNRILPDQLVGDFDSVSDEVISYYRTKTQIPIRTFDPVKDASDTEIAVRVAMELKCGKITVFGATGTRIDHIWANVQTLYQPFRTGIEAELLDTHNRIRVIGGTTVLQRKTAFGPFFSVFPLAQEVSGFSIEGAKYPLHNHTLTPYDSLCVSNEYAQEEVKITFPQGIVILMETRDI